jgi:hypothetical protein
MTVSRWLSGTPGAAGIIGPINAAIDNFDMSVQWTPLTKNRPGPDYDQHQQFELINGMVSVVQAIMESKGMTEAEAIEHVAKKAEHDALIASLAPPMPEPAAEPNAEPEPEDEQEPETQDSETE